MKTKDACRQMTDRRLFIGGFQRGARDGTPLDTSDFFKKPFPDYEKIY